jgi:hypothetical protein
MNACVNWGGGWVLYSMGYKRAGDLLVQHVSANRGDADTLVYPIVFINRQTHTWCSEGGGGTGAEAGLDHHADERDRTSQMGLDAINRRANIRFRGTWPSSASSGPSTPNFVWASEA